MSVHENIYLVRHGEANASWSEHPNPGLSDTGFDQADAVCERLARELEGSIPWIATSPLVRAHQTALPLQSGVGRPITICDEFREVPSDVPLQWRQNWLKEFMASTWEEQSDEVLAWREDAVNAMLRFRPPYVIFTHFMVINALVSWVQAREETLVFWPAHTSVTVLTYKNNSLFVNELGEEMQGPVG